MKEMMILESLRKINESRHGFSSSEVSGLKKIGMVDNDKYFSITGDSASPGGPEVRAWKDGNEVYFGLEDEDDWNYADPKSLPAGNWSRILGELKDLIDELE